MINGQLTEVQQSCSKRTLTQGEGKRGLFMIYIWIFAQITGKNLHKIPR